MFFWLVRLLPSPERLVVIVCFHFDRICKGSGKGEMYWGWHGGIVGWRVFVQGIRMRGIIYINRLREKKNICFLLQLEVLSTQVQIFNTLTVHFV